MNPALRDYLRELDALSQQSRPSAFWEDQLARLPAAGTRIARLSPAEQEALVRDSAYGFAELPDGVTDPAADPGLAALRELIPRARAAARALSADALGIDPLELEHLRALDLLTREGLLEEYLAFIAGMGVRSSMATARHWYYAREIAALADTTHPGRALDVLEIGAGAGNLACMLERRGLVRSYTVVDLPRMLVHSAYTIGRHVPGAAMAFNAPARFAFYADVRAHELPDEAFDLCLNVNSFMEMDRDVRDGYIGLVYRTGRPGALFFNVNRHQRAMPLRGGGSWDNNPLLYPYRPDDRVLRWEEDRFQAATRGKWGVPPSPAITRAAVIRPGTAR